MKTAKRRKSTRSVLYKRHGSAGDVQKAAAAPSCTNPSIDKSVQEPIVTASIGDFRKRMKSFLDGKSAVLVGVAWHPRAILLPGISGWRWDAGAADARRKVLTALLTAALEKIEHS